MSSGRMKELLFPLNYYRPVEADYLETEPGVGKMEIKGHLETQEDAMKVQKLAGFAKLYADQQDAALKITFLKMQQAHGNHAMQGSTAISATAYIDSNNKLHATVANLGDSEAYIVTIDKDGKTNTRRLNINLHNLKDNKSEQDRILATDRRVMFGRVDGSLAVSRAVGDTNILRHESDHHPEIDHYQVQLEPGQKAYLVVGCDGLYEKGREGQSNEQKIEMVNNAMSNHHADLGAAVNKLVATAFNENFSGDNISVAVVAITPGDAVSVGLFDGHGGNEVSAALGEHFFPELERNIAAQLGLEVTATASSGDTLTDDAILNFLRDMLSMGFNVNKNSFTTYFTIPKEPKDENFQIHFDGKLENIDAPTRALYDLLTQYGLVVADKKFISTATSTYFTINNVAYQKLSTTHIDEIKTAYNQICEKMIADKNRVASPSAENSMSEDTKTEYLNTKTQVLVDFDGTLTGVSGQHVFDTLLRNGNTFSAYMLKNHNSQTAANAVAKELLDQYPEYRIQEGARDFLIRMADEAVNLSIISRNYRTYLIAAMHYAKIPNDIIDKISLSIFDRNSFVDKKDAVALITHSGVITTFVLDDSPNDRQGMISAVNPFSATHAPKHTIGQFDWGDITAEIIYTARLNSAPMPVSDAIEKTLVNATMDAPIPVASTNSAIQDSLPTKLEIDAISKKEFLNELSDKLNSNKYNKDQILDLFEELKKKDGAYHFIHEQRHPKFDKLKLLFKSNKNTGENNFWHTRTYQQAVKLLKNAYIDIQKRDNLPVDKETTRGWNLINYTRGNAVMHREHTSAHEEREQIGKPGKK